MSSGLLVDLHSMHTVRRSQDKGFCRQFGFGLCDRDFMSSQVLQALQGRSLTGVSGVVILQTGSSF